MIELFRNATKIKALFDDGHYVKAAALLLKTLAALAGEFEEDDDDGRPVMKAKRTTKADVKQLEAAEATLASIRPAGDSPPTVGAGGLWMGLIIQLLPVILEIIRNRKGGESQPA